MRTHNFASFMFLKLAS